MSTAAAAVNTFNVLIARRIRINAPDDEQAYDPQCQCLILKSESEAKGLHIDTYSCHFCNLTHVTWCDRARGLYVELCGKCLTLVGLGKCHCGLRALFWSSVRSCRRCYYRNSERFQLMKPSEWTTPRGRVARTVLERTELHRCIICFRSFTCTRSVAMDRSPRSCRQKRQCHEPRRCLRHRQTNSDKIARFEFHKPKRKCDGLYCPRWYSVKRTEKNASNKCACAMRNYRRELKLELLEASEQLARRNQVKQALNEAIPHTALHRLICEYEGAEESALSQG